MVHQHILHWLSQMNNSSNTSDDLIQSTPYGLDPNQLISSLPTVIVANPPEDALSLGLSSSPPSLGEGCQEDVQNSYQTHSLSLGSLPAALEKNCLEYTPYLGLSPSQLEGVDSLRGMPNDDEMSLSLVAISALK
ncbi:hypothetical protein BYT27DRAFT_7254776 [Phlegmacium glaucopus]|nr:hypothetical protein BYT27DRAFT_7254776 [Phlegmacium glaucopus]